MTASMEQSSGGLAPRFVVLALGFITLVSQTILLREFLGVFGGNELVIGMVLAGWMLLTALGAFAGRSSATGRPSGARLFWLVTALASFPLFTVFILHAGRNFVFPYGSAIGPWEGYLWGVLLLAPLCLVSGSLFTVAVRVLTAELAEKSIARAYALEAIGSAAGGLLYSTLGIFFLTTYQALVVLTFGGLLVAGIVGRETGRVWMRLISPLLMVTLAIVVSRVDLDHWARGLLFPGQAILLSRDTPHGNLTVTGQGKQKNFFENGTLFFSTNDIIPVEESVHYAMVQHPSPRTVLLIGGGVSGSTLEILKYGVGRVDYAEVNPAVAEAGRRLTTSLDDPRIRVIGEDGRLFVKSARERYDVALVNVPEPLTAQLSRYYSVDFLRELKQTLAQGAVVQFSLFPASEYRGAEARSVGSILVATLRSAFREVLIVPGARDFYLASDSALTIDIAREIARKGISTVYVNAAYIDDELNRDRSENLMRNLDPNASFGRDFAPVAYIRSVEYWLSAFGQKAWLPGILMLALALGVLGRMNAVSLGMFTGGFSASALELVILFGFQIVYGVVYQMLGLLVTLFMGGLASGAWLVKMEWLRPGMTRFIAVQGCVALLALALAAGLPALADHAEKRVLVYGLFGGGIFLLGILVGCEFALAAGLQKGAPGEVAGKLYGVDLFGSAVGALVVAAYAIPLLGVDGVCLVVCALSLLSGAIGFLRRDRFQVES